MSVQLAVDPPLEEVGLQLEQVQLLYPLYELEDRDLQSVGQEVVSEQQPDEEVTSDKCVHPAASTSSAASAAARSTQVEVPICSAMSTEGSCLLCMSQEVTEGSSWRCNSNTNSRNSQPTASHRQATARMFILQAYLAIKLVLPFEFFYK